MREQAKLKGVELATDVLFIVLAGFFENGVEADLLANEDLQAVLWTHIGPATRISSLQFSESIHNVLWQLVQRPVEQLLQNDLELLRNWNATNMAELAEKRA